MLLKMIVLFFFEIENYELGAQTINSVNNDLAIAKGQHIHFIVNNGPYSAHYNQDFSADVKDGDVVLAFLSRSYHESVKIKCLFLTHLEKIKAMI